MEGEAVKRNTKQYLAPMKAQATPRGVYDLYPAFPVGENKIRSGIGCLAMIVASFFWWPAILPLAMYLFAVFLVSWCVNKRLKIAALSVVASIIQLGGYGMGFLKAFFYKVLLGRGRDEAEEVRLRKGK